MFWIFDEEGVGFSEGGINNHVVIFVVSGGKENGLGMKK